MLIIDLNIIHNNRHSFDLPIVSKPSLVAPLCVCTSTAISQTPLSTRQMHRWVCIYLSIYHLVIILFHKVVLKPLIDIALEISQLKTFIDRDAPSVIT